MALLETHLREIQLCSSTIADLPFPPSKIFTNAILRTNDITALIRDTEAHERALFSVAPPAELSSARESTSESARRSTIIETRSNESYKPPRRNTAVAAVLGGDMAERIRREKTGDHLSAIKGRNRDDIDVELLLKGAEKLCTVYPMPEAMEKIAALRNRYKKVAASTEHYERLVAEQSSQLKQINRPRSRISDYEDDEEDDTVQLSAGGAALPTTEEDLRREEESVRELERKKRTLEERVSGMEKDLGGILR